MEAKIRKTEIDLSTIGMGVILFGIWSLVKFALSFVLFGTQIDETLSESEVVIINITTWTYAALDFLVSFYIGFSARAEAKGKRKTLFYLILSGILLALYAVTIVLEFAALFLVTENILSILITIIIDATSAVFLLELIINSATLRRLRKQKEGGQA